ncbi:MAG TPA: potassium-transporting ATPase subunit KdpB [Alphaproteobacteria bacterium]|nr:potassium-transporting ATPase subunit KdpB [Alphaproteobacteria bacterium]
MAKPKETKLLDGHLAAVASREAFVKLNPGTLWRNPVIFVTEIVAAIATILFLRDLASGTGPYTAVVGQICAWLWFTVLCANFAEAVAEGRGKARAESLRKMQGETTAHRVISGTSDEVEDVPSSTLRAGDIVSVSAGEIIPGDGEVIEGIASIDESAITGESAPVIRESGSDRSGVTGGTRVVSDQIKVRITAKPGESFLDRMIRLVEGAERQKTPNEIALNILLVGLTIIFLVVTGSLEFFASYSGTSISVVFLIALLVTLIPTTIGGLLSAIGIAGMDRLVRANVIAKSGRAVEAAGDVDTLLLDKTGTITFGNRMADDFVPAPGVSVAEMAEAALLASLADETPEGKSIVKLAGERYNAAVDAGAVDRTIEFSAFTRMSGADLKTGEEIRKGAVDAIMAYLSGNPDARARTAAPEAVSHAVERISKAGGTPLAVARGGRLLGVVHLKDIIKPGIRERFRMLRQMGIRTVMITGDNPLTAATIAAEAGVDDYLAEATPEKKLQLIRDEQKGGKLVAMCGDGSNDAPALAQADVGVAMNSGTPAAKEAGNLIDLDSDPTKLIEVVLVGKQLLISRGSLTTFSIANDVAKYFAIIPALFVSVYPQLQALNVMRLASPQSAILSAIIFNALIIIALVPLALRGVQYTPSSASALLRRNLLIYGLGGIVVPFLGIKAIDLVVNALGLA